MNKSGISELRDTAFIFVLYDYYLRSQTQLNLDFTGLMIIYSTAIIQCSFIPVLDNI